MPNIVPRIGALNALFGLNSDASYAQVPGFAFLPLGKIRYFHKHPFRLYAGERLNDLVESIRKHGILTPAIVRHIEPDKDGFEYEMLAGHNRHNGAVIAGLSAIPCIIKENLSDKDAWAYVIETNVFQRSFKEMLPSEKAAVLALHYSEMFSQGKRNDIISELEMLEGMVARDGNATCGTEFHKLSRDAIGEEYGLTGRSIAKYIRLDKLSDDLKQRLDDGDFTVKGGVHLSYLSEENQHRLESALTHYGKKVTDPQANALRQQGTGGPLKLPQIQEILQSVPRTTPAHIQIRQELYAPYFAPNTPAKEVEQVVAKALAFYFSHSNKEETA